MRTRVRVIRFALADGTASFGVSLKAVLAIHGAHDIWASFFAFGWFFAQADRATGSGVFLKAVLAVQLTHHLRASFFATADRTTSYSVCSKS